MQKATQSLWRKHRMWILIAILPVFFLLRPACSRIDSSLQDEYLRTDIGSDLRSVFDEYKKSIPKMMKKNEVPGLSIAVVDRDGILWTAGFGHTDFDRKTPVTSERIFSIQGFAFDYAVPSPDLGDAVAGSRAALVALDLARAVFGDQRGLRRDLARLA